MVLKDLPVKKGKIEKGHICYKMSKSHDIFGEVPSNIKTCFFLLIKSKNSGTVRFKHRVVYKACSVFYKQSKNRVNITGSP